MLTAIINTIQMMNWNYGRGDLLGVVMDQDWKGGTVTRKRTSCEPETARFKFNLATKTVYFARHQSKVNQ